MVKPMLMRISNDCEIAAISTASGLPYERVEDAFLVGDCGPLTNPVRGNPLMSYAAIARLGLWKRNITWGDLVERRATPGKTVILVHLPESPTLVQHWVVLAGYTDSGFLLYWGDREEPRHVKMEQMKSLFLAGWPNCAYEIIPGTWWQRFMRWIGFVSVLLGVCAQCFAGGPTPPYSSGNGSGGPGFAPMQRGSAATPAPRPGGMDLPATTVAAYLAEDAVDGGAGQYMTCANLITSTVWPASIYSSVEAEKPTLGSDTYGDYWLVSGSKKNLIGPTTISAASETRTFIQVIMTGADPDRSSAVQTSTSNNNYRLGRHTSPGYSWGWGGSAGSVVLDGPPYLAPPNGVPCVITHKTTTGACFGRFNGSASLSWSSAAFNNWSSGGGMAFIVGSGGYTPNSYIRIYAVICLVDATDADILQAETELMTKYGVTP